MQSGTENWFAATRSHAKAKAINAGLEVEGDTGVIRNRQADATMIQERTQLLADRAEQLSEVLRSAATCCFGPWRVGRIRRRDNDTNPSGNHVVLQRYVRPPQNRAGGRLRRRGLHPHAEDALAMVAHQARFGFLRRNKQLKSSAAA